MKQFNLKEYLKNPSRKIITRDGRRAKKILCTDAKSNYPIVALVESEDKKDEYPLSYTVNGQYCPDYEKPEDLFFALEKHEVWLNIFSSGITFHLDGHLYASEERAKKEGKGRESYIATGKLEWME